jgi:hypothetical protein
MEQIKKNTLLYFFENICSELKNNQLSDRELKKLYSLFTEYQFEKETGNDISTDHFMKYYTMGWYIYTSMEKNK